jgi:ABC-type multidrug transport system fused ATPase/permease subunit
VTVFLVMIILGIQLGSAVALTTLFSVAVYFPLQRRVALSIGGIRRAMVKETDMRVNLTSEALKAIRAIKMYAWESPIAEKVAAVRAREIGSLWSYLDSNNVLRNMNTIHLPITALLIFVVYVFAMSGRDSSITSSRQGDADQKGNLTVSEVLLILAYLNIIRFPLNLLAQAMKFAADGKVL